MISTLLFSLLGLVGLAGAAGSGSSSDSISPTPSAGNKPVARPNKGKPQKDATADQHPAAPIDETPVVDDTAPVMDDTAPVVDDTAPVVDDTAPVVDDTAPVVDDTAPVVDDTAPVVDDTAPVVDDTTAPVVDDTAPVVDDTAPVVDDTTAPVVDDTPPPSTGGGGTPAPQDPTNPTPTTGSQPIDSSGGSTTPVDVTSSFSAAGGRVTTLQVSNYQNVDSIRILSDPAHGNLSVNPDNTLALVMSHEPGFSGQINFSYEVSYADGSTQVHGSTVDVQPASQQMGWGQGNHYMLETDANGDVVVEYGDNHREVYISGSPNALSLNDIAALEGVSVSQITQSWLASHSEYGSDPSMALDSQAGMRLWSGITGTGSAPSSNWLLFERGYEYDNLNGVIDGGTIGEDPMHPIHVTAYGTGARPVLNTAVGLYGTNDNIVFSGLSVTQGISAINAENLIFDDMEVTNGLGIGIYVSRTDGVSVVNSSIVDVYDETTSGSSWTGGEHSSGLYAARVNGLLIENTFFDHNGWAPDYQEDLSASGGQPPNMFSHNVYIDWLNSDVTFRDNITMRASSIGVMVRSGGYIEDNLLLDNNIGGNFLGGDYEGRGAVGQYTLFTDNVITSALHNTTDSGSNGAVAMGIGNRGVDSTLLDNIITHLADPNNPAELASKPIAQSPLYNQDVPFYDDTIIYNWLGQNAVDRGDVSAVNTGGLDTNILDATTIQIFTQQLLGDPNAGIPELADFLRAQADGSLNHYVDADLIIDFFQTGFGLNVTDRLSPDTLRFIPDALGDGIRWDNRINWSTDDLPGTVAGDSVDLGGNWVNYGGTNTINDLDLGDGGTLNISNGRLNVAGQTDTGAGGGTINVSNVGQIWMNDYDDTDQLTLNVTGGRFANTGDMSGNTLTTVSGGQAILATDGANYDVENGSELHVIGSGARVGFDGNTGGTAVLRLADDGTLSFSADSGGIAGIEEFRSGALGAAPDVASGANLGLGALKLDLSGLAGTTGSFRLISVDEMIGEFSDIEIIGLAGNQNAELVVDYDTDALTLNVTGGGNGSVALSQVGQETDMDHADSNAIWAALTAGQGTYSDDLPTDLVINGQDADPADELLI